MEQVRVGRKVEAGVEENVLGDGGVVGYFTARG